MPNVTNELIFEVLKQVQADVAQIKGDLRDVKVRLTSVEEGLAGVNRRIDRMERLERRVGLVEN